MNQLGRIWRLYCRDALTLSEIERRTGLTRQTIRRWLKAPEGPDADWRQVGGSVAGATVAGRDSHPLKESALPRRTEPGKQLQSNAVVAWLCLRKSGRKAGMRTRG